MVNWWHCVCGASAAALLLAAAADGVGTANAQMPSAKVPDFGIDIQYAWPDARDQLSWSVLRAHALFWRPS
jgi:hypothetical protein